MSIRYSDHLQMRLKMRGIPHELPRIVYQRAPRRFIDAQSGLKVAVTQAMYFQKKRQVAVAYREDSEDILLITIHPLKPHQFENRIASGRWKEVH